LDATPGSWPRPCPKRDFAFTLLVNHPEIWGTWVTAEAAAAVMDALEAGEIPDGWPVQ
jgi:hypothetical protein